MSQRTLVISATNVLRRGFLVVPTDRKSLAGAPVNGLFAVARALTHVIAWRQPARAVAVITPPGPEWPELLIPQCEELPTLLLALGFTVVESDDEANCVASYVEAAKQHGGHVVIVGMDKRYAQLVGERVVWYDANKDARYTEEVVEKRFNVPPAQVADWLGLVGDDDALSGVAGIGAKGATQLLQAYGSVGAALEKIDSVEPRLQKALMRAGEALKRVELAKAHLKVDRPLPIPLSECVFRPNTAAQLNAQFEALGFVELLSSESRTLEVKTVKSASDLATELAALDSHVVSLSPILEEASVTQTELVGLAFSQGAHRAVFVSKETEAWPSLLRWLSGAHPKSGHDLTGLQVALTRAGAPLGGQANDSGFASHLTEPSGWAPHDLEVTAKHVLGRTVATDDEALGVGQGRKRWSELPVETLARTAAERATTSWELTQKLIPDPALLKEYLDLEQVVVRMEVVGIGVDSEQLRLAEARFEKMEKSLEQQIHTLVGHSFNINSSPQLGRVLFEELKLPSVSRTKMGPSTANEALERIEHAHPVVSLVLRFRVLRRLRDSWIHSLQERLHSDGRVHSRFSIARSFSGRLVNSNPDLGRVPGRTDEMAEIRRAFVAAPGKVLMSVDFNQLGLHVLAHLSEDPMLMEPLQSGADLHRLTAAAILEKPADAVTIDERQLGKVVNFATFAGQGPSSLALQLGVSAAEAKQYIARFDAHYAKVREFQDRQFESVKTQGFITTLAGRRWPIGGLSSLDSQLRSYAERLARRATHEGSVADVSRRALLEASRALRAANLGAEPLVQVVDEVLFEVPEDELQLAAKTCATAMKNAFVLKLPLKVSVEVGPNWADLKPLALTE